jgi:hypothetical protein
LDFESRMFRMIVFTPYLCRFKIMAGINEGVHYLKSVPSVLKILEIVCIQRLWRHKISYGPIKKTYFPLHLTGLINMTNSERCEYTLSIITSQLHRFQLRTTLNENNFKFFFSWAMHREAEHPSSTHARKTFLILINKYGNKH